MSSPKPPYDPQPVSRTVRLTTGLDYHVLEWPSDAAHTVVLVHGFLDSAHAWQPVVAAGLSGRFHLVAPDMRGHGRSDRVGAGGYYYFADYLADLESLVTQLGRERVSLVGHSMGGSVVSYFAGAFPERVHRLALLEGLGPPEQDEPLPARTARWIASARKARQRTNRCYPSLAAAAERLRANDPQLSGELASWLAEHGTETAEDGVRFLHDPLHLTRGPYPFSLAAARAYWQAVTCPVLLVEGETSPFRELERADERKACFRDSVERVLAGAGHMMHRHAPAELAAILAEFLGATQPRSS